MNINIARPSSGPGRARRLRAATHPTHDALDQRIMKAEPFSSLQNYTRFLRVQLAFHHRTDPLYASQKLQTLIPDLGSRRRLDRVQSDFETVTGMPAVLPALPDEPLDVPLALGWLYVIEGSNLGAAFLLKDARNTLGLSETHGASHLAGHADGRGLHWRNFTAALDAIELTAEEESRAEQGANEAFAFVRALVEKEMPAA